MSPHHLPRLITIGISHYCEKARWALDYLGIAYREERHVPPFHRFSTQAVGGSSTPVFITETAVLLTSDEILNYLESHYAGERHLYPPTPSLRHEVEHLEDLFNTQLGLAVRQWSYFYALSDRAFTQQLWCPGTPLWERLCFPIVFSSVRNSLEQLYDLRQNRVVEAYEVILEIMDAISDRLADGRPYLVGDSFSAADLTFASMAALLLFPPEYGFPLPSLEQTPPLMVARIEELRQTPAGQFVLRLYQTHRHPPLQ